MITICSLLMLAAGGLEGVQGADKAAALPQAAKSALAKDNFTVVEGRERHFFSLYDRNAYEKVPSFITADVVLHVMHTRFDDELANHEVRRLLPALKDFASSQLARALSLFPASGAPYPPIESLALFHAIPLLLLDENVSLDPRIAAAARADVRTLKAATGELRSKACGLPLDASLLLPRGHYDRLDLRGYFQASTWYAQCVFRLDRDGLARAVNLVRLIDPKSAAALRQLEASRACIAGAADDPGVGDLEPLLAGFPPLPQPVLVTTIEGMLAKLSKTPRVASRRGPVFAVLGGARTFDAEVLGLSAAKTRTPSVLEVLAALGSPSALRFLGRPAAPPSLPRGGGLSQRWLDVLTVFVGAPPEGQPPYARTSAWEGRVLTAAAGSWAELKHDTLLYVKQPVVMREGGHEAELPAAKVGGYVDPRPDVYRAVLAMNDALRALDPDAGKRDDAPGDFLRFVIAVSELELSGKPFPREMDERLRTIGSELEELARTRGDATPRQALVADVLTIEFPDRPRSVLHVGVGDVDELWVVVPRAGKRVLMRGGVFSFYEFMKTSRMTDQDFIESLPGAARPVWAQPLKKSSPRKN
ncbi:MAG: DUF3160 domain-containing protein [Archangium sp.]|nr:DUF3160 domain-containing protein [Archangium sp.]MDP3575494.1 DUF3160 domain-containing protein [Archangium sp.]